MAGWGGEADGRGVGEGEGTDQGKLLGGQMEPEADVGQRHAGGGWAQGEAQDDLVAGAWADEEWGRVGTGVAGGAPRQPREAAGGGRVGRPDARPQPVGASCGGSGGAGGGGEAEPHLHSSARWGEGD